MGGRINTPAAIVAAETIAQANGGGGRIAVNGGGGRTAKTAEC